MKYATPCDANPEELCDECERRMKTRYASRHAPEVATSLPLYWEALPDLAFQRPSSFGLLLSNSQSKHNLTCLLGGCWYEAAS